MEGEQAPVAPAPASEAPNTNEEQAQAPAQAAAPAVNLTSEQAEAFNKFMEANGGFDKAFAKVKSAVSNPQPAQQETRVEQQPAQPVQQAQTQIPEGYITQEEFALQQYFGALAREEAYAPIADKINNGEVFQEMAKFGIRPAQNGMFNDTQVRDFLGLLAKTVPAQAPETKITNTPTVDYYEVGDEITSSDQALAIMRQNMDLRSRGMALHPRTEDAKKFLSESFKH